jgi:sortase (surface protein transpeptidase)
VLDSDQAMLSLVTCYPFNAVNAGTPMRYVVSAEMIY